MVLVIQGPKKPKDKTHLSGKSTDKKEPVAVKKPGAAKKKSTSKDATQNPGQIALNAKFAAEAAAKKEMQDMERAQLERWSGKVWPAHLKEIKKAMQKAQDEGKTPLLLDQTENKAVDTFYCYAEGAQIIEVSPNSLIQPDTALSIWPRF